MVILFTLQKIFLFKCHFLKYAPRLLSRLLPPVTDFKNFQSLDNKLGPLGTHWFDDTDIEAASQKVRGTRQFISSVNEGSYETGLHALLNLSFSPTSRSTAYDLSERLNYCFLLFICQDKPLTNEQKMLVQKMAKYVMENLEYYGTRWTNNHYLNNARALLSASILLEDRQLASRALYILKHALKINFPNDIFQERSTSYQYLIGYWLKSIYFYVNLIEGTEALKKTVLNILAENEVRGLQVLNFGDNTPDFSKFNIQCLNRFFDQFLPKRKLDTESKWLSCLKSDNSEIFIITREHERYGPEHGYRNLACFHLIFKGHPIFLSTARASYNKATVMLDTDPGSLSSGHILVDGQSIYGQKDDLPMLNYCTDPKTLPFVSKISNDKQRSKISLLINSMHGKIDESFHLHADEFCIKFSHQDGKAMAQSFLIPEEFSFTNESLISENLNLAVITSKNLTNLYSEPCYYSDDYSVTKKGFRLIAMFCSTTRDEASFIKFKEK